MVVAWAKPLWGMFIVVLFLGSAPLAHGQSDAPGGFGNLLSSDLREWQRVMEAQSPEEYETFIEQFPNSPYARLAKRQLRIMRGESVDVPLQQEGQELVQNKPTLGLQVKTLSQTVAAREGLAIEEGLVIVGVDDGQAAKKAGLRSGDVIQAFNGEDITSISEISGLIRGSSPGEPVTLGIWRDGAPIEVMATMGGTVLTGLDAAAEQDFIEALAAKQAGNEAVAWPLMRRAAEAGHSDAQMEMGHRFYFGQGVPENAAEALPWYVRAATGGNPAAHLQLGSMYWQGLGADKDTARSRYHFRVAAEAGNRDAQYAYGLMLENGDGGPKDPNNAIRWIEQAAAQGLKRAQDKLVALDQAPLADEDNLLKLPN